MEFLEITNAQYVGGHKIHLWFNNKVDKVVDFSDKLNGAALSLCGIWRSLRTSTSRTIQLSGRMVLILPPNT
jgi:hypothetical protein